MDERTVYEIWINQAKDPLRSKVANMVSKMFEPSKRQYMHLHKIAEKETEKGKCSLFPNSCIDALISEYTEISSLLMCLNLPVSVVILLIN